MSNLGRTLLNIDGSKGEHDMDGVIGYGEDARVRIAASAATSSLTLKELATDDSPLVRAAIAMNPAVPPHVDALLALDNDERVRALLARKIATALPDLSAEQQTEMRLHAERVLFQLVNDEAARVRAAVAEVVKTMEDVPHALIIRLARDQQISVSEPILRLSPLLTDADLLSLLSSPPHATAAEAIARRPHLSDEVADAIATSSNTAAIRALLVNSSAAIREATLDSLISRAASHLDWHEPLIQRPVLSAQAAMALASIVTNQLLHALAQRTDLPPGTVEALRLQLVNRRGEQELLPPATVTVPQKLTAEQALRAAHLLKASGRLSEATIVDAISRGEARYAAALLAVASDVALSVVDRAVALRSGKGLASLAWKSGFTMRTASLLQTLLARLPEESQIKASRNDDFPLSPDEMRWQISFMTRPSI